MSPALINDWPGFVAAAVNSWRAIFFTFYPRITARGVLERSSITLSDVVQGEPGGPQRTAAGF